MRKEAEMDNRTIEIMRNLNKTEKKYFYFLLWVYALLIGLVILALSSCEFMPKPPAPLRCITCTEAQTGISQEWCSTNPQSLKGFEDSLKNKAGQNWTCKK